MKNEVGGAQGVVGIQYMRVEADKRSDSVEIFRSICNAPSQFGWVNDAL